MFALGARDDVYAALRELGLSFEVDEHEPVFTIEEMEALGLNEKGMVVKNLFLRDQKGKKHFLVLLPSDRHADLKSIGEQLGAGKLSFASEERLAKYLGLSKGSVTPLGMMNDREHAVEVAVERSLTSEPRLGVHPNENTATVWLSWQDLKKYLEHFGARMRTIKL